jgi:hypothetical protein
MSSSLGSDDIENDLELSAVAEPPAARGSDKDVGTPVEPATLVARSSAMATGASVCCALLARARLRGFAAGACVSAASGFGSTFERGVVFFAIYPVLAYGAHPG